MKIRKANLKDLDAVAELFNGYRMFYKKQSDVVLARCFIEDRLKKNDSIIFVAENDKGGISGFAQLYPTYSSVSVRRAYIFNDLYIHPDYRKRGVARHLIDASKDFCKKQSAAYLMLETAHDNFSAQSLYEKCGFEKETGFFVYAVSF